jgi:hypothetical protein
LFMTLGRNHSRGSWSPQAWAYRYLLSLAVALSALFASPTCFAQAPMCDPTGATVTAPVPAPPSDDGEITFLGCPLRFDFTDKVHPGQPTRAPQMAQPFYDDPGLLPAATFPPLRGFVVEGVYGSTAHVFAPFEYHSSLFRPPRSPREV